MLLPSTAPRIAPIQALLGIPAAALGLYYLSLVLSRPDVPAGARVRDPGAYGWPEWFGRPGRGSGLGLGLGSELELEAAGDGNGDREVRRTERVLVLVDHKPSSPHRAATYAQLSHLSSFPAWDVRIWGRDSPDWDTELGVDANLASTGCPFDVIWRRGDEPGEGHTSCPGAVWIDDIEDGGPSPQSDINMLHNPVELLSDRFKHANLDKMPLFGYLPPAADPTEFYPGAAHQGITYFPKAATPRNEWPRMPWGNEWKIYSPATYDRVEHEDDVFVHTSKTAGRYRAERQRLAAAMRQAAICVFEEWADGVVNERYAQAMLSGCLVVSVRPATHHDAPLWTVPASNGLPVLPTLSDSEMRRLKIEGVAFARQHFSPLSQLRAVDSLLALHRAGERGYIFPASFSLDCASAALPWCHSG